MSLKERFSNFRADLHELKAAAQAHNVASYEPPPTNSSSKPDESAPGNSSIANSTTVQASSDATVVQPGSTATTTIQPSPDATILPPELPATEVYILPPPPPRNLPHGWTARYDKKEGKFCYSHGVGSKKEQWEFPNETPSENPIEGPAAENAP